MRLTNAFTVPAPADEAFAVLLDVERVAPCLPGATLAGGDGETFDGAMTIKLGPVRSRFEGTVQIVEADRAEHRAVLRAQARDARGSGTAAATITTTLRAEGGETRVEVETDLQVSGPVAQFGRGVMQDVSGRLMRQFADCLAEEMGAAAPPGPAVDDVQSNGTVRRPVIIPGATLEYEDSAVGRLPKGPAADAALAAGAAGRRLAAAPRERRTADVLDLGAASRGAVLKRAVPVAVAAAAAVGAAVIVWRRRAA